MRNKTIDNSWIVPYNPYFSLKYNCHINVESCASVKSVKYLFKYVYKGHDCANVVIQENALNHDEIKTFMDSRYVSAPEAAWRLFGFNMHEQSHTIIRLPVHLPNEQDVYFNERNILQRMQQAAEKDTKLTAWFKLNQEDETARTILYSDIPKHYVFDEKHRKWNLRQRGAEKTIGRMYSVSLGADPERFCLRLLLLHISGATSFQDLKSVNGVVHTTFKEAAMQCGLMNNDDTWENTLDEAILCSMPKQLRELFAYICVFAVPANAHDLYQKIKLNLCEDYVRRFRHLEDCNHCENLTLLDIQNILLLHGKNCGNFNLPTPIHDAAFIQQEMFDPAVEQQKAINLIEGLNIEQKAAFYEITNAMQNEDLPERCFFLEGLGGCGKTYVYKTLLSSVRGAEEIALPVASTGIAANLLQGGRTYHSQFKLPVPLLDTSTSSMRLNTLDAEVIRKSKVIIWDESTMAPSTALKAIDKLLKEIMKSSKPFGGKTLLIGGDFCQTLPVIPHGTRAAIVEASIKFNENWKKFKVLKLKNNVRSVHPEFSQWLVKLGNGTLNNNYGLPDDIIEIPQNMICKDSLNKEIFGDRLTIADIERYSSRAILCSKNSEVDEINQKVLDILEGEEVTYLSADSIDDANDEDRQNYPVEFLNEQAPSGMPLHKLRLKIGCLIMLLRNLNTKRGLCNGTRLIVRDLKPNLIIAEILNGAGEKEIVFIPKIDLAPTNTELPFVLRRRQFPVKLAFAMTINKSQGQTLDMVGIYLPEPVFSHGQLYVAISRARRACDVKIKILDRIDQGHLIEGSDAVFTKNVVYKEIFTL